MNLVNVSVPQLVLLKPQLKGLSSEVAFKCIVFSKHLINLIDLIISNCKYCF